MARDPTPDDVIPFVTVTNWIRAAAVCGFNIQPLFREVGLDLTRLHPEQSAISVQALRRLLHRCVQEALVCDPHLHFPLVLGETFAFDYLSDVETFITTSPTLREATPVLQWMPALVNPFMSMTLQEHGSEARIVLGFTHEDATTDDIWPLAEAFFVTFCKFSRFLLGDRLMAARITFQHEARPGSAQVVQALTLPVSFGEAVNALWFDRSLLDVPLRGALPSLHEAAARRVAEQVAQRAVVTDAATHAASNANGLTAQIEARLRRHPELLGQGIDALAGALGLHPRTLQRRLREEGEQHSGIVNRVRHDLAQRWLVDPALSIEDISDRLGFADRRSFTQAFTRWAGMPPSDFRKTQGNP